MKLIGVVLAFGIAALGQVQQDCSPLGNTGNIVATFRWTAGAGGAVTVTPIACPIPIQGLRILQATTQPGSPAPTNGYSVVLRDSFGADLMQGGMATVSSTASQIWPPGSALAVVNGTFSLVLTGNSVVGAKGVVVAYFGPVAGYVGGGSTGSGGSSPFQSLTTNNTSGPSTLISGVLNVPNYATGGGGSNLCNTSIATTTLTAEATATSGTPCIYGFNDSTFSFTAAPTVVISVAPTGNGSFTLYVTPAGGEEMQITSSSAGTFVGTNVNVVSVVSPNFPAGSYPKATGTITNGSTSWTTVVDARPAAGDRAYITASTGIAVSNGAVSIDSTVPQKGAANVWTGSEDFSAASITGLPASGYTMNVSGQGILRFTDATVTLGTAIGISSLGGATGMLCEEVEQFYASATIHNIYVATVTADATNHLAAFVYNAAGALVSGATTTGVHPLSNNDVQIVISGATIPQGPAYVCIGMDAGTGTVQSVDANLDPGASSYETNKRYFSVSSGVSWAGAVATPPSTVPALGSRAGSFNSFWGIGTP